MSIGARARFFIGALAFVILCTLFSAPAAHAAPSTAVNKSTATKSKASSRSGAARKGAPVKDVGVTALIRTDGAMVYAKPDFDAEVLTTLNEGQKVRVSSGTIGEVVKFHKVRAGPVLGYVAEIDVQVEGGVKKREHKRGARSKSENKTSKKSDREKLADQKKNRERLPFIFTRYVGLLVGVAGYEDEIRGVKKSDSLLIYGLKITGPDILFQGPILDMNLMFHYGAPKGYSEISLTKPSGFLILGDVLLLIPVLQRESFLATLGLGPLLTYRSFRTVNANGFENFSGAGVGLSLAAGAGFRRGDYAFRLEGKYLLEKRVDTIFQLSLQNEF
jgi:hypothetical protein